MSKTNQLKGTEMTISIETSKCYYCEIKGRKNCVHGDKAKGFLNSDAFTSQQHVIYFDGLTETGRWTVLVECAYQDKAIAVVRESKHADTYCACGIII